MASISKSQGMWRVRIRHKETPQLSRVFDRKGDATQWAIQTEQALQLGLLSPDHDCTLAELLHRYALEITPKKKVQVQKNPELTLYPSTRLGTFDFPILLPTISLNSEMNVL